MENQILITVQTRGVKRIGNDMQKTTDKMFVNAFAIPLGIFDLSDSPQIDLAKELIKEYDTVDHLLITGGRSSWNVDYGSILHNPKLQDLKERVDEAVNEYVEHLGLEEVILGNSWFNIMPKGGEVIPHRHERSTISGALYIDSGTGAAELSFTNPTSIYRMAEEVKNHYTDYTSSAASIEAKKGRCVLFPSWLEHGTDINEYEGRIVISFNYINLSVTKFKIP